MPDTSLNALLFDLDGTIADTHALIHRCLRETTQEHLGRDFEQEWWEQGVGQPLEHLFALPLAEHTGTPPPMETLVTTYRANLHAKEAEVTAFPGIIETLHHFHAQGVRLAVVTTKFGEAAYRHLDTLGIRALFGAVITGDQCARLKPDPEPFLRALACLCTEAEQAVGIGDSALDMRGARAAGARTAAATWGTVSREALLAEQPDYVVHHPTELLFLLR